LVSSSAPCAAGGAWALPLLVECRHGISLWLASYHCSSALASALVSLGAKAWCAPAGAANFSEKKQKKPQKKTPKITGHEEAR
jgi:hypothetical protein